jgi:hypothetical protein
MPSGGDHSEIFFSTTNDVLVNNPGWKRRGEWCYSQLLRWPEPPFDRLAIANQQL